MADVQPIDFTFQLRIAPAHADNRRRKGHWLLHLANSVACQLENVSFRIKEIFTLTVRFSIRVEQRDTRGNQLFSGPH